MPAESWRISPARTRSLWLTASASAGSSRRVGMKVWDQRTTRLLVETSQANGAQQPRRPRSRCPRDSSRAPAPGTTWLLRSVSLTRLDEEACRALVPDFHPDPARRPGRRRGGEPQAPRPRRTDPPALGRHLLDPSARL